MSILSDNLKRYRFEKGLSQSQLAEITGLHINTISNWERGGRPKMKELEIASDAMGVSVFSLLSDDVPLLAITHKEIPSVESFSVAEDNTRSYCFRLAPLADILDMVRKGTLSATIEQIDDALYILKKIENELLRRKEHETDNS